LIGNSGGNFGFFQHGQQGFAGVPRHVGAGRNHVIANNGGNRDGDHRQAAELCGEGGETGRNRVEDGLIVADQIHLVHRQHHLANAKHCCDRRVAPGLHQQSLARINQQHGEVGHRGASDHVSCILFVAGRIGENEAPRRGFEIAIGDIDSDALFAFGGKPIDQQRVVDPAGDGAIAGAVAGECHLNVIGNAAAFIEQPADQGGFSVIDRPAGQHAQQGSGHQKYPSRFFFSIEDSWS